MSTCSRRRVRFVLLALLLVAGAAWIAPSYFNAEGLRPRLQAGLERALHRPVKFGAVSFRLLPRPGFSIENAEIEEDPDFGSEPFARVDRIDCDLRWRSLWRSRKDFARLRLEHSSFNLVLNREGEWNVGRLLRQSGVTAPTSSQAGTSPAQVVEPLDLEVEDARADFKVGANKIPFALTDVKGGLHFDPAAGQVVFQAVASPVRPDLAMPTPGPVEAAGTWTPGRDLEGPIDANLRLRRALLYDWIPLLTGHNPDVYGVLDSDVRLRGALLKLTVEGESRLTQLQRWGEPASSDPLPCTFRFRGQILGDRQRVLVENLDASFANSHLHLSGSVDHLRSTPQLDLVAALERSRLEDVEAVLRRLWPRPTAWSLRGRVDGMFTVQGPWKQRRYGGFVGAREVSLVTPVGAFPVSEPALRITNHGAHLAPARVTLAPHVVVVAEGAMERENGAPSYDLQLSAKTIPLHDAVAFGRGVGIRAFQGLDANGSASVAVHLTGRAWPWTRPELVGHGQIRGARLLIPGLTEPLDIRNAICEVRGDQVAVNPLVAVLGTSTFTARLAHRGPRRQPWQFQVRANTLNLEQGALWFAALGRRRPLPLLERLPGLRTFAERRNAAAQLFGSLNAEGEFATSRLSYRSVTLQDFKGRVEINDRSIQVEKATFRVAGSRGEASGRADFSTAPIQLTADTALAGLPAESLTSGLPISLHKVRGALIATGHFETHGLAREELAENLVGDVTLQARSLSLGDYDPLEALAREGHWGELEPLHGPVTARAVTLSLAVAKRRVTLVNSTLDLSGATLQLSGNYTLGGTLSLEIGADLGRMRRRWLVREDPPEPGSSSSELHLAGPLASPVVVPQVEASRARE